MDGSSWTQDDLTAVRQAKLDLITGKRVVSREVAGKTTSFQACSLDQLNAIETEIIRFLGLYPRRAYAKNAGSASI